MGLLRRPTPGEIVEGGRLSRPCGPGTHSRAISENQFAASPPIPHFSKPYLSLTRTVAFSGPRSVRPEIVGIAEPDAQCQTPVAQVVQRDRLPCDLLDAPPRERSDHRPETKAVRLESDGAECHPRRGPRADTRSDPTGIGRPNLGTQQPWRTRPRDADPPTRRTVPSTVRASCLGSPVADPPHGQRLPGGRSRGEQIVLSIQALEAVSAP